MNEKVDEISRTVVRVCFLDNGVNRNVEPYTPKPSRVYLRTIPKSLGCLHGVQLKAATAMVRLRIYSCLLKIPAKQFSGAFTNLLRQIVTEVTLNDQTSGTMTSLLCKQCHKGDSIILGIWQKDNDHQAVEEQLQINSAAARCPTESSDCHGTIKDLLLSTENTRQTIQRCIYKSTPPNCYRGDAKRSNKWHNDIPAVQAVPQGG
eukprot:sb/3470455/